MGTLTFDDRTGRWRMSWVDAAGGQHRKLHSTDKAKAQETLDGLVGGAIRDRLLGISPLKRIRFDAFAERFLAHCRTAIKVWKRYQSSLRSLTPFFHNRFLSSIDADLIEQYRQKRSAEVTKSTINRDLQVLKRMFTLAITWGFARENPVKQVRFYKESTGRVRYLNRHEFGRLYERAPAGLKPLLLVAVNTGMRQGEMLGLSWGQVDLENSVISLYDTKNSTPRKVRINETVRRTLLELRLRGNATQNVFCDTSGQPLPARTIQCQFTKILEEAGITNFRFHDLRHTCASWLAMSNVSLLHIQHVLGHKDVRMTLRYAHLAPDQMLDAVKRLDEFQQSQHVQQSPETSQAEHPSREGTHNV